MKKTFLLMTALSVGASIASADLLVSDDFNYTGALTANGWSAFSGADASITSDGNLASIGSGAEDIRLAFADQTVNPVYASFTLNISSLPTTGSEYSFGFTDNTSMESRFGILASDAGTTFRLSAWAGSGAVIATNTVALSLNTDYLVAIYFNGVDDHRLWINPGSTDFASPDIQATGANNGIDSFFIRQAGSLDNGASAWAMDDLTVATTFLEVVPEPATLLLMGSGLIALTASRRKIRRTA